MSRRTRTFTGGVWETSPAGWLHWVEVDGTDRVGFITLRPFKSSDRLAPGVEAPTDHDWWLLAGLLVEPPYRGQGRARALLELGGAHLLTLAGSDVWLGLMTDNLASPAGRTRMNIRGTWDAFVAAYPGATTEGGSILLTDSLGLGS